MQLTLDDLRKASDPLAALLGMSDSDLDRVAAEIQGYVKIAPKQSWREVWAASNGQRFYADEYRPARDLNQAYELADKVDEQRRLNREWSYCNKCHAYRLWWVNFSDLSQGPDFLVMESQAGSHARAVVVLAILGLLQSRKDGAA